jgi:hypothetical protein
LVFEGYELAALRPGTNWVHQCNLRLNRVKFPIYDLYVKSVS